MRVAYDPQIFLSQRRGGISRYVCSLVNHLKNIPDLEARIFAPLHFNDHLAESPRNVRTGMCIRNKSSQLIRPISYTSKLIAGVQSCRFRPDIIHETYHAKKPFGGKSAMRVTTIYDAIHEKFPDLFQNAHLTTSAKRASIERSDHIICISESTRSDVIEIFGVQKEQTSVVYLGVDIEFHNISREFCRIDERPYILFVGARGGYKNFSNFLTAYASSESLRSEVDILCFGGGEFTNDEISEVLRHGLSLEHIRTLQGGDVTLSKLYRDALLLAYPSIYEGFGIPPLEAMAAGCPVVCSNQASLPEVVGDAAELFDPAVEGDLLRALERLVFDDERRSDLINKGLQRQRLFTWDNCALETYNIYRKFL